MAPGPSSVSELLRDIAAVLTPSVGGRFFHELVLSLSRLLGVDYVFVGKLLPDRPDTIRTLAFCNHGQIADNIDYRLEAGTPCGSVECRQVCYFPEGSRALFPEDDLILRYGVEAFIGYPLLDAAGNALGLLAVMHEKPVADREYMQSVLGICAGRTTAEIERASAEAALRENATLLENVFSNTHVMAAYLDPQFNFIRVNEAYAAADGRAPEYFTGKNHFALYPNAENERLFREVASTGEPHVVYAKPFEYAGRPERGVTWWDWSLTPVKDKTGRVAGLVLLLLDVTGRIKAEAEMRKLSSAMQQTADAVMITDRHGIIEYVNPAFEQVTGYSRAEAVGKKSNLLRSGLQGEDFYVQLWGTILAGNTFREVFINRKKNGDVYYEEKTISPLRDPRGHVTHFISTGKDITERMQVQERLHYLAHHDALTELPNRVLFMERLGQALQRGRWSGRTVSVMFLDLDRFKYLNDTLGHDIGDRFLRAIAARLREAVRERDTVARLGGDEFAILLDEVAQPEDMSAVAAKVLGVFAAPFAIDQREFYLTASIGISVYPNDGDDATTLLKHADTAMYRAKDLGKNNFQFYSADMSAHAFERLTLENSLRRALERNEFALYYQPQVELGSHRLVGAEALLRWHHPELGLIGPLQFIPLAEETGLIGPLGEWVLRAACAQARAWEQAGWRLPRIAVNLSGHQFHQPGFVESMQRLLGECSLQSTQMEFEITESAIMKDARLTAERLQVLHGLGVRFAVDDFGTGYSSLSYLRRFPISTLKVDKSFIQDVTTDADDAEIVRTIVGMAHNLRIEVVAEGVETPEQLALLRAFGCDAVQGYYFSRPLPAEALVPWLRAGGRPGAGAPRRSGAVRKG